MIQLAKFSVTTSASPEEVFKIWSDVDNWPIWDEYLASSQIYGEFKPGTRAVMKPKSGLKLNFIFNDIIPARSFANTGKIPGGRLYFEHEVEPNGQGALITHTISVAGPLAWFWSLFLKRSLQRAVQGAVTKLSQLAAKR